MAAIVLPSRSRFAIARREPNLIVGRKPIGDCAVDWSNPDTRGLRMCVLHPRKDDIASGEMISGTLAPATSPYGIGFDPTTGGFSTNALAGISGPCTFVFVEYRYELPIEAYWMLLDARNDGGSNYIYGHTEGIINPSVSSPALPVGLNIWIFDDTSVYRNGVLLSSSGMLPLTLSTNVTFFTRYTFSDNYSKSVILMTLFFDENITADTRARLNRNPFRFIKPANQSPFLISIPGGGGAVSGSGDLIGAGSQIVGTGIRTAVGSGALVGAGAAIVGTGMRTVTGTGALTGQGAEVSGVGATGGAHTGVGDLVAAGSAITGVGIRTVAGSGALIAQGSAVVGVGERSVIGSGDLVGAGSDVSGAGAVGGITVGVGDLVGAGSQIIGAGARTINGVGAIVAQGSAIVGAGERTVVGAGALVGSGSEIVGAGVGGDVTTGVGDLVGAGSAVTGTGMRVITGAADLVAAGSIVVGAGVRTVTGAGVLVGAGSAVVGSYTEEDCTDVPIYTQFDEPVNALHEAILSQFGEEVTFSGIGLTATAVFKRYKDDVPGGGARPGVPRDVLRIKQTDICAHAVDQGAAVTVRGQAYKVISVERTKHGMTNLGIRRAH